jgi:two-component system OmpR family sensor kinase
MAEPSLERRLSRAILATVLVVGLVAAVGSFFIGYVEASRFQDATLRQVAAMSYTSTGTHSESDNLSVYLPGEPRPAWLPERISPGFHTVESDGESIRVFVRELPGGARIVTAQPTELRQDVASRSALHSLVPVLFLLPLLAWLTARVLAAERRVLDRQRRFIADAAHELRSPLTALSLQAENVSNATSLETARERAAAMRTGIDRTRRLTDQLLRLSRSVPASGQPPIVALQSLARESISEWTARAQAKGIDLGMEEQAGARVRADVEDLRLVLNNALDNAIRCTPEGGMVTVRVREEGPDAVLEVADNGPSIPPEHRAAVFEAFHRLGNSGEGSGLGLSIARDAAARAGGRIALVDPQVGPGLVFRYTQRKN